MLELREAVGCWNRKILIPGMLWIKSRECVSCGTRLRLGKHGFQEYPGPPGAPSGRTLSDKFASPSIIRREVKSFASGSSVSNCNVWRYDLLMGAGEFLAGWARSEERRVGKE